MSSSPSSSTASLLTLDSASATQTKNSASGYVRAVFNKNMNPRGFDSKKDETKPSVHSQTSLSPSTTMATQTSNNSSPQSGEWTDSQYAKMAKANGWSAPTATKPSLGGV